MRFNQFSPDSFRPLSEIEEQIHQLKQDRAELIRRSSEKALDPKDAVLVSMAHEAGELKGLYTAQVERNKQLETVIEDLNRRVGVEAELRSERDTWRVRAKSTEETLIRSQRAKKALAKKKAVK